MPGISASCQQAIVLEGCYWKRRIEVVIKEYHKWRIYYKKRVSTPLFKFVFYKSHVSSLVDFQPYLQQGSVDVGWSTLTKSQQQLATMS